MTIGDLICQSAINLSSSESIVSDISISKEGRVKFNVPLEKFKPKSSPNPFLNSIKMDQFYIDTAGSIIVKKFLPSFLLVLQNMSPSEYNEKFIMYNHLHFGVETVNEFLEFTFHVSFLHDFVLDNFLIKTES